VLSEETRFLLGNEDYIRTRLKSAYDLVLRAEITGDKDKKVKYLLTALGTIRECLKLLGASDAETVATP